MAVEPLVGKRRVAVTDRRTNQDFAELLRCLSDEEYPETDIIVLVTDNLNTHSPACLAEGGFSLIAYRYIQACLENRPH